MFIILAVALTVYGCYKAHQGVELPAVIAAAGVTVCLGATIAYWRAYTLYDHAMIAALVGTIAIAWWTRKRPVARHINRG